MKKFTSALLAVFMGLTVPYHGSHSHAAEETPMMCHIPSSTAGHDHEAMMAKGNRAQAEQSSHGGVMAMAQDSGQDDGQQPPPHQPSEGVGCSRPHPNDPDKGSEPNTIACHCVRRTPCNNGEPGEDPGSPDDNYHTRCKNWCFKSRCSCPNPCKS